MVSKLTLPNIKKFITAVIRITTFGDERMRLIFIEIGKQIIAPKIKHISIPVVHVTSLQIMIENIRNTIRQILKYDFFNFFSLFMQKSNATIKQCKYETANLFPIK